MRPSCPTMTIASGAASRKPGKLASRAWCIAAGSPVTPRFMVGRPITLALAGTIAGLHRPVPGGLQVHCARRSPVPGPLFVVLAIGCVEQLPDVVGVDPAAHETTSSPDTLDSSDTLDAAYTLNYCDD